MKIQTTKVFEILEKSDKHISVLQGGARASKTYNTAIWFIVKLLKESHKILTVARLTMPSLKTSVFIDYQEILRKLNLWDDTHFNKSEMTYRLGTNLIQFRNLDDDQKVRGAKRDYLHLNEANEVPNPIWKQLIMRTASKIVLDYNPSDEFHWIYDEVITRDDTDFNILTYKDNPFLPISIVNEIERLKEIDENYWRIYGLGERGISQATIFTKWDYADKPFRDEDGQVFYGLDFGFNHPTGLIKAVIIEHQVYFKQLLYKTQLTAEDIIQELISLGIPKSATIYADCARPEMIEQIYRAGFNIKPVKKGPDSVMTGIDIVKRHKIYVDKESVDLIKELRSYKWKVDKNGKILDEPVKVNDDLVDSCRYALNFLLEGQEQFGVLEGIIL